MLRNPAFFQRRKEFPVRAVGPNTQQEGSSLNNEPGSTVDAVDCAFQAVDDRRVKVDPQCL
ncbi:hypothetical protein A8F46_32040 [Burkholderia cenocepacia]|nr:hypothetical protein A8F46_32040 [Burkholderia cenocepacia]